MARLEEITTGSNISGVAGQEPVTVVAVKWYGNTVLEITFKDAKSQLASQLLYREDEGRIEVIDGNLPWSFDGDANLLRLVSEAYRIHLAHLFDPYLAVHTSEIDPKKPFRIHPDFAATSVTYNIAELTGSAEVIYQDSEKGVKTHE